MYAGGGSVSEAILGNSYKFSDCSANYFKLTLSGEEDIDPAIE